MAALYSARRIWAGGRSGNITLGADTEVQLSQWWGRVVCEAVRRTATSSSHVSRLVLLDETRGGTAGPGFSYAARRARAASNPRIGSPFCRNGVARETHSEPSFCGIDCWVAFDSLSLRLPVFIALKGAFDSRRPTTPDSRQRKSAGTAWNADLHSAQRPIGPQIAYRREACDSGNANLPSVTPPVCG